LGNNQVNFQLHRFTANENIAKSFRELLFLTHTVDFVIIVSFGFLFLSLTLTCRVLGVRIAFVLR